jgi:hypothetical protein
LQTISSSRLPAQNVIRLDKILAIVAANGGADVLPMHRLLGACGVD